MAENPKSSNPENGAFQVTTTLEAWAALTPEEQAWKKKLAVKALTHWNEQNPDNGLVFREVPIAEFDLEQLRLLCLFIGQQEIKHRDELINRYSPEKVFGK